MDQELISLEEASRILSVPIETLLRWNEFNILKPTITSTGKVGYRAVQINQFLSIQNLPVKPKTIYPEMTSIANSKTKTSSISPLIALFVSLFSTLAVSQLLMSKIIPDSSNHSVSTIAANIDNESPRPETMIDPTVINSLPSNNITFSQVAKYPSDKNESDTVFDNGGNIKGEMADSNILASAVTPIGIKQSENLIMQTSLSNILLVLMAMFLLSIPLTLRHKSNNVLSYSSAENNSQKVLEINQKTDGTVVICCLGQEYKISKPELDSESDQFIEKILKLVTPGLKEIEYDSSQDSEYSITAPLSKLVTRLGFVGIKRDLFFPRTSKNRVYFRKYLTKEDLNSMGLNIDQLSRVFFNS